MKSLVLFGGGRARLARRRQEEGAIVVLWRPEGERVLREAGVAFRTAAPGTEWTASALLAWTQAFSHRPLVDGRSFAELLTWKGQPLDGCAEAFFREAPRTSRCVRLLEVLHAQLGAEAPDEVEAIGLEGDEALLLGRLSTTLRILYHGPTPRPSGGGVGRARFRAARAAAADLWREVVGRKAPPTAGQAVPAISLVGGEAGEAALFVDPARYTHRGVHREVRRSRALFRREWHRLRRSPALHEALGHRGVSFADLAAADLAELLLVELPRTVRRYEETAAALLALQPRMVFLRSEDRAAQAACRAADLPFVFPRARKAPQPESARVVGS